MYLRTMEGRTSGVEEYECGGVEDIHRLRLSRVLMVRYATDH